MTRYEGQKTGLDINALHDELLAASAISEVATVAWLDKLSDRDEFGARTVLALGLESGSFYVESSEKLDEAAIAAVVAAHDGAASARASALGEVRRRRDELLIASDWTQLPDAPLDDTTRAAWATYRQALRDIPNTPDAEWPIPPASNG